MIYLWTIDQRWLNVANSMGSPEVTGEFKPQIMVGHPNKNFFGKTDGSVDGNSPKKSLLIPG